jgi:hypothetical protein
MSSMVHRMLHTTVHGSSDTVLEEDKSNSTKLSRWPPSSLYFETPRPALLGSFSNVRNESTCNVHARMKHQTEFEDGVRRRRISDEEHRYPRDKVLSRQERVFIRQSLMFEFVSTVCSPQTGSEVWLVSPILNDRMQFTKCQVTRYTWITLKK